MVGTVGGAGAAYRWRFSVSLHPCALSLVCDFMCKSGEGGVTRGGEDIRSTNLFILRRKPTD